MIKSLPYAAQEIVRHTKPGGEYETLQYWDHLLSRMAFETVDGRYSENTVVHRMGVLPTFGSGARFSSHFHPSSATINQQ